jgi:Holliday junction resolvase RusA-like endonuclease
MIQQFVIGGRLPGLNEYTRANRRNRYEAAKVKKQTQEVIIWEIRKARLKPFAKPIAIRYTWIEPNMRRDKDNISFAQKFIQDALVDAGILTNDGWKNIASISHAFRVCPSDPRIIVEMEEVNEDY